MSNVGNCLARGRSYEVQNRIEEGISDDDLVIAAQVDQAAFAILYQRYVDAVFRFCYRRLGDRATAEDATSAVFERALTALPRFKAGSFRAWLFTIARNAVVDVYRASRDEQELNAAWAVADHRPGPEQVAVDAAEAVWIRNLLAHLNPHQRAIVELRLAGLTDVEISQVLGRSHGSIRTAQYRALQRLRGLFGPDRALRREDKEDHHVPHQSSQSGRRSRAPLGCVHSR